MFNKTGKQILIENCHWGSVQPAFPANNTPAACPYNYYRSSGDVSANFNSVLNNLKTVFPHADAGVSYPGCWAYPDMLEVRACVRSCVLSCVQNCAFFVCLCV